MTTEDDFQKQLDLNRDDRHTLLVFADWLQERGDPRADGYRALATLELAARPYPHGDEQTFRWYNAVHQEGQVDPQSDLPKAWFLRLGGHSDDSNHPESDDGVRVYRTSTEARDSAARAWLLLSETGRAAILANGAVTS